MRTARENKQKNTYPALEHSSTAACTSAKVHGARHRCLTMGANQCIGYSMRIHRRNTNKIISCKCCGNSNARNKATISPWIKARVWLHRKDLVKMHATSNRNKTNLSSPSSSSCSSIRAGASYDSSIKLFDCTADAVDFRASTERCVVEAWFWVDDEEALEFEAANSENDEEATEDSSSS